MERSVREVGVVPSHMDIGSARSTRTPTLAIALVASLLAILVVAGGAAARSGGIDSGGGKSSWSGKLKGVSPSYAKFAGKVSKKTRLSLRVMGAWSLAEGGPKDNPLNIGPGKRFGTVGKGARATTHLLHEDRYRRILRSRDLSDGMQIKAIANSPWCPGCHGYGRLLHHAYKQVKVKD